MRPVESARLERAVKERPERLTTPAPPRLGGAERCRERRSVRLAPQRVREAWTVVGKLVGEAVEAVAEVGEKRAYEVIHAHIALRRACLPDSTR